MNRLPWWGSVLLAIMVYYGLKYGAPQLLAEDHRLRGLLQLCAPLAAMALLLLAAKQLYDHEAGESPREPEGDTPEKPGQP